MLGISNASKNILQKEIHRRIDKGKKYQKFPMPIDRFCRERKSAEEIDYQLENISQMIRFHAIQIKNRRKKAFKIMHNTCSILNAGA